MGLFRSKRRDEGEEELATLLARATQERPEVAPAAPARVAAPEPERAAAPQPGQVTAPQAAAIADALAQLGISGEQVAMTPVQGTDQAMVGLLQKRGEHFDVAFDRDGYAPGDEVSGRIVAREELKGRRILVGLRNYSESNDYSESVDAAEQDTGTGHLTAGQELRFSLRLPDEMAPAIITPYGRAFWALSVQVDRKLRRDQTDLHLLPLAVPPSDPAQSKPGDGGPAEQDKRVRGFDGEIEVDRSVLPLGATINVVARIGKPEAGRDMKVGLFAEAKYDVEETTHDDDGHHTSRVTRTAELLGDWVSVDSSIDTHRLTFTVPEHAPPSFTGRAFSVVWRVRLTEDKRLRRDPQADAIVRVVR